MYAWIWLLMFICFMYAIEIFRTTRKGEPCVGMAIAFSAIVVMMTLIAAGRV